jgi:membrane-associated phospholipid phosphatase
MKMPWLPTLDIAKCISIIGHPFILLPLTITLALFDRVSGVKTFSTVAIYLVSTILPLLVLIWYKVSSGKWADYDVSDQGQRRYFYPVTLAIAALNILLFWLMNLPRALLMGAWVSLFLLLAGVMLNLRWKVSLHTMFGAYCAIALLSNNLVLSVTLLVLVMMIGWSRVVLGRHTVGQVISGTCLGSAGGLVLLWLVKH